MAAGIALGDATEADHKFRDEGGRHWHGEVCQVPPGSLEQRLDEFVGVERPQIVDAFADADEAQRNRLAARAIAAMTPPLAVPSSLVMSSPVTPTASSNAFTWLARSGRCSRRARAALRAARRAARDDALHLPDLLHEMQLGRQPPGGVGEHDVDAARLRRLTASKMTAAGSPAPAR